MDTIIPTIVKQHQSLWMIVRIIFSMFFMLVIDLLLGSMNPYIVTMLNLIIVFILEPLDSIPMQLQYGKNWCKTIEYKIQDKIADTYLYMFVLILHLRNVPIIGTFEYIFIGLFIYRFIGIILYITTKKDIYLVLFPNLFSDIIILYIFLTYVITVSPILKWVLIGIAIPMKIAIEGIQHLYVTKIQWK